MNESINRFVELEDVAVRADMLRKTAAQCPRNRTHGRGRLTTEQWEAARETNYQVGAGFASKMGSGP